MNYEYNYGSWGEHLVCLYLEKKFINCCITGDKFNFDIVAANNFESKNIEVKTRKYNSALGSYSFKLSYRVNGKHNNDKKEVVDIYALIDRDKEYIIFYNKDDVNTTEISLSPNDFNYDMQEATFNHCFKSMVDFQNNKNKKIEQQTDLFQRI